MEIFKFCTGNAICSFRQSTWSAPVGRNGAQFLAQQAQLGRRILALTLPQPSLRHCCSIAGIFGWFLQQISRNEISSKLTKLKSILVSALFLFDINCKIIIPAGGKYEPPWFNLKQTFLFLEVDADRPTVLVVGSEGRYFLDKFYFHFCESENCNTVLRSRSSIPYKLQVLKRDW